MVGFLAKVAIGFVAAAAYGPISYVLKEAYDGITAGDGGEGNPLKGGLPLEDLTDQEKLAFFVGTVSLIAKMTAADGDSSFDEVRVFRQVFRIDGDNLDEVTKIYNTAKKSSFGYEEFADELVEIFGARHDTLDALLDALFSIAYADHVLTGAELEFLRDVGKIFGLNKVEFDQLAAQHDAKKVTDPYMVLGVRRTQATVEIEHEYRRQMERYSPQILSDQGLPNAFAELADMRMALLTEAMERILTERDQGGLEDGETPTQHFQRYLDLRPLGMDFKGFGVGEDPRYASEEEREVWRARNEKFRG
ncbi:MAG: TerB family tellurite resistance protein [Alphaproteobacteria bacterium]|nr:TerB family tellurite resistance protein [Alphaproteobacteria bacterium SS10]